MTDRWTEAQLRQQLYWVLALEWAGGTWYVSTAPLEILDGADKIVAIPGLVDVPDVEEALDLWATDQPTLSVALSFTLPVDVPALISKGHDLAGAKATLCQHAYGDTWGERRVVVQGQLVDPEYDAAGEPITCSVEEQISDDQTTLPFSAVTINETTFPTGTGLITTLVEDHLGAVVPLVFGSPGGGVVPGSPAYLLGEGTTAGTLIYLLACHTIAAATVTLQAEDYTTSPAVAVDHWTLDDGRVVAYATVTGFTASRDVRVIWNDGAALADETGEGIVGAGDLMAYILRRTTLRVDWGRLEGQRQQLNAYELGGYVDEPVAVGEYLRSVLLDVLPAGLVVGPEGVYPLVWRWAATTADAICDLDTDVDVDVDRVSRVGYSGADELANTISLRYQLDARQDDYSASQLIAPAPELTFDSLSSPEVQVSYARFGDRRLSRETAVVHDAVTAVRVVQWLAARYALPARSVTYAVGPRLAWLQRGDVVTLTDSEIAASSQVCIVESIRWLDDGGLGVTLRYVERRG